MSKYRFILSLLAFLLVFMQSSCLVTKTDVGTYRQQVGDSYTYSKAKQVWIFWGVFPIGRTNTATPPDRNCQIITKFNGVDFLISWLTLGVVTTRTIKVKAKSVAKPPRQGNPTTDNPDTPPTPAKTEPQAEPKVEPQTEPQVEPKAEPNKVKFGMKVKAFFAKVFKKKDKNTAPKAATAE